MPVVNLRKRDWTSKDAAEAVIGPDGPRLIGGVAEEVVGSATSIAIEVPARAMNVVGSALDGDVHCRAGGVTLLRVECICLDFEFLHCVRRRREAHTAVERIVR